MASQPPPAPQPASRRVPMVFDAPRHGTPRAPGIATARRWAAGGLALPTLALLVLVAWFVDATGGTSAAGLLGIAALVLPGVLVGWCTGFATLALLVRDEHVHPRLVGLVAAVVGSVLGALLLPLAGFG